ncbi:tRNA (guanine-N1)-methyltransferase [Rhodococcus sp. ADH]|uniref:GNAT family N-acetyltransferase n=1 Tax=Rhodococcus sp. ADH TaxID=224843 RepID=UPI0006BA6384|nr:GNAT family N-acetyltransferase [Rhodococcus sp. ADH]KPH21133.1 tRNA (guanine-N1)-methyltransferase [Rhodococcus sp. ADH]RGP46732.1 tRNA (guanine-N1)-methyltransferase [Rhodococcus erythropolis]
MPLTTVTDVAFSPATTSDAAEILVLQRCCWVSVALSNESLDIPALHENLDTVRDWIESSSVTCARSDGRLVGAVRGSLLGSAWQIARLMVSPDWEGRGLGRRLLESAEENAPAEASRFELSTGSRSLRNIQIYTRAGYSLLADDEETTFERIEGVVYLAKHRQGRFDS